MSPMKACDRKNWCKMEWKPFLPKPTNAVLSLGQFLERKRRLYVTNDRGYQHEEFVMDFSYSNDRATKLLRQVEASGVSGVDFNGIEGQVSIR